MKKILKYIGCVVCLLAFTNCADFLDREPTDALAKEKVWTSDTYALNAVNGLYRVSTLALQGYGFRFSSWGPDGFNYFYSSSMETGIATPSEGYFLDFYTNWYNMIRSQ